MTTTTTTLVHRPYNGPSQWWREGLVYEVISPEVTADDLRGALDDLAHVSSLGFQTLLYRQGPRTRPEGHYPRLGGAGAGHRPLRP